MSAPNGSSTSKHKASDTDDEPERPEVMAPPAHSFVSELGGFRHHMSRRSRGRPPMWQQWQFPETSSLPVAAAVQPTPVPSVASPPGPRAPTFPLSEQPRGFYARHRAQEGPRPGVAGIQASQMSDWTFARMASVLVGHEDSADLARDSAMESVEDEALPREMKRLKLNRQRHRHEADSWMRG